MTSERAVRESLTRVTNSAAFQNSERLKQFLRYVVAEALAGRADSILGKTIAADVFDRDPEENDCDNVVRVEARRLRRKLDEYYRAEGREDPVRIHIDAGGYAPRFEALEPSESELSPNKPYAAVKRHWPIWTTAVVMACAAGYFIYPTLTGQSSVLAPSLTEQSLERRALREKSLTTLEAANLDGQGRGLLFPIADPDRQRLATSLFRESIDLDPTYFGGYAGAAHSLGTLAILSPAGPTKDDFLRDARDMAQRAVELAPAEAWSHSAAAWSSFAAKDYEEAMRRSELAFEIAPHDGNVLDYFGLVMLFTGHFEGAREASSPERERHTAALRLAHRNVYGVASFHLGDYAASIASFEAAAALGDPVSEFSLVFQAVSHEGAGNSEKARALVRELSRTYPDFDPERAMRAFYRDPEHVQHVMSFLDRAGWNPDS